MKNKNYYKVQSQLALPFLGTNRNHLKEIFIILELKFGLKKNSKQKLIDLGAGDGRIVIYSALNYGIKSTGIEINSNLIENANEHISLLKREKIHNRRKFRKIKIKMGDLFQQYISKFDYIYIYSMPTMQKYLNHVFLTAKKGAIIISYRYPLKDFESYLKLEHELRNRIKEQEVSTFFYRKI